MNVVSYGGGVNSTAMIIGMCKRDIPIDLILFADTGAERPETYEYIELFGRWLSEHGLCGITVCEYCDENGERLTLEDECLRSHTLPAIAYGRNKACSIKHKTGVQDKYCNNDLACISEWKASRKVHKFIGYDAGEEGRRDHARVYDIIDKKYTKHYPLIDDWSWYREDCCRVIQEAGLPLPGKSSCFFCPSMKPKEIRELHNVHPDLFARAIAIEDGARLESLKGLGRDWSWEEYIAANKAQGAWCELYEDTPAAPCGCYDG